MLVGHTITQVLVVLEVDGMVEVQTGGPEVQLVEVLLTYGLVVLH